MFYLRNVCFGVKWVWVEVLALPPVICVSWARDSSSFKLLIFSFAKWGEQLMGLLVCLG